MEMDFDNECLIMLVQGFDCLYDPNCKEYKNRNSRVEAWGNVCKGIVGGPWEELSFKEKRNIGDKVQKRWKCLKDAYTRSLKTRVEKRESGGKSGRPYVYEQQMAFLSSLQTKSASSSLSLETDMDSSDTEEIVVNIDPDDEADRPLQRFNSDLTVQKTSGPPAKKRLNLPLETSQRELSDSFKSSPSASPQPTQSFTHQTSLPLQYNEEDKMFLLSLLPSMQDMSPVEKMDFKIKVMNLLKDNMESRESRRLSKSKTVGVKATPGQEGKVKESQCS